MSIRCAITFEMLAGRPQVKDGTHVEVVIQHRRKAYPSDSPSCGPICRRSCMR